MSPLNAAQRRAAAPLMRLTAQESVLAVRELRRRAGWRQDPVLTDARDLGISDRRREHVLLFVDELEASILGLRERS